MQEHLGRLDGVKKVDVHLENGRVVIYPKRDAKLNPALILKTTYDSGVSVAEMTITGRGQLVKDPEKGWLFKITGDQIFEVIPNTISEKFKGSDALGAPVTLRGRLYKKPARKSKKAVGPLRLEILEVLTTE